MGAIIAAFRKRFSRRHFLSLLYAQAMIDDKPLGRGNRHWLAYLSSAESVSDVWRHEGTATARKAGAPGGRGGDGGGDAKKATTD